jgi:FemAB-related protein (PEP-CTERM system-associated)
MINVELYNGTLPDEWDAYVAACSTATPYHLSGWKKTIEEAYGHKAYYLAAREGRDVAGILPLVFVPSRLFGKSLTSMPFLTYGGLCADNEGASHGLLDEAWRLAERLHCDVLELRHTPGQKLDLPSIDHKVAMVLELQASEESVWEGLRSEIRNRIRKAAREGVAVEEGGAELIPVFYEVFAENMRDLGSPVHSRRFFESMFASVPDQVGIVCARLNGRPVAGGITVTFRDGVEMPWVSASRRFQNIAPNNAVYWHAIRQACRKGLKRFDFGRSTPGSGTFEFKRRWGAEPVQLHWQYRERTAGRYCPTTEGTGFGLAGWAWKKMPVSLTKVVGPGIRRQITL